MKIVRRDLAVGGVGVILGVAASFGVDVYRDWSLTRQCEEQSREVSIFLEGTATPEAVAALERELSGNPGIESVEYISQEEAFEEFTKLYEDQPHLYETINPDDLPSVFRLVAANEETVVEVSELDDPAIDEVRAGASGPLSLRCFEAKLDRGAALIP